MAGVVTGSVIGAGLALVLAPWSGDEARDELRAKASEASNLAKDALADVTDQALSTATDVAGSVSLAVDRSRAAMGDMRRQFDDAAQVGRAAAEQHRAELEERHPQPPHSG